MTDRTADSATAAGATAPHRTVLLRRGEVHSPADPFATAMVVERGHIAWVGSEGAADAFVEGVDEVVDLDGALVTPAFTDAHVHTTSAGLALTGLDLSTARSLADALDRVRAYADARPADRVLLGHGWDAARWPERRAPRREELDLATGGRPLYLSRIDVHSAVVTTALLDLVPGVRTRDDEPLTRDDHHAVRAAALDAVTPAQRAEAQRAALDRAASLGIGSVHECGGPGISSAEDFTALLELAASRPDRASSATGPTATSTGPRPSARSAPPATSSWTAPSAPTPPACTPRTPTPATPAPATSTPRPSPNTSPPVRRRASEPASTPSATPPSPPSSRAPGRPPPRSAWTASAPPGTASSTPR
ncbi:hypothetical protein GCM10020254_68690 [Streptomyces goshikiensis]